MTDVIYFLTMPSRDTPASSRTGVDGRIGSFAQPRGTAGRESERWASRCHEGRSCLLKVGAGALLRSIVHHASRSAASSTSPCRTSSSIEQCGVVSVPPSRGLKTIHQRGLGRLLAGEAMCLRRRRRRWWAQPTERVERRWCLKRTVADQICFLRDEILICFLSFVISPAHWLAWLHPNAPCKFLRAEPARAIKNGSCRLHF